MEEEYPMSSVSGRKLMSIGSDPTFKVADIIMYLQLTADYGQQSKAPNHATEFRCLFLRRILTLYGVPIPRRHFLECQ